MNSNRLFLGCFFSLVATAFGFAIRGAAFPSLIREFNLSNEQLGYLGGVGLFPFAISIILLSLVIDKIGYGRAMVFAFVGHVAAAVMTIYATNFAMLYWGTFIFALANGTVEAVVNPVVATMYGKEKTRWLNILHAGWPLGLVLGGLLAIAVSAAAGDTDYTKVWRWQMGLILLPTIVYGLLLLGRTFPVQERVAAGVSFKEMLSEFGWGSAYICFFLLVAGINQILVVAGVPSLDWYIWAGIAVVPTIAFALWIPRFGRPMFVFLLLIMFLLATTELGTDGWMPDIVGAILKSPMQGTLFLVYTSFIMFVLRFFAGPIVHKISPLGLLAVCAAVAAGGLVWLANAGTAVTMLFLAATFYAFGKTFFWPTTLGVVSEQYPRGGALMLNAIAGVGMIAVGTLGAPGIGTVQDHDFDQRMQAQDPVLHGKIVKSSKGIFGTSNSLDQAAFNELPKPQQEEVTAVVALSKQATLAKIAVMPAIMCVCYLLLIFYFKSKGGYKAEVLTGHAAEDKKFTGGVPGPVE